MWVPNHRPPLSCVLPHKLSRPALEFWNLPFLPTFFHSFWSRHFSFSRLNAEPQRSRSCCSQLSLSSRGLNPVSWAIRKKWASHRKSPFTVTWDATGCDTVLPGEASTSSFQNFAPTQFSSSADLSECGLQGIMLFLPTKRCLRNSKCYQERHDYQMVPLLSPQTVKWEPTFKPQHTGLSANRIPSKS